MWNLLIKDSIEMDREADKLASEILMPAEVVKSLLSDTSIYIDHNVIINLSNKLKVSKTAMIVRLIELKYNVPCLTFY